MPANLLSRNLAAASLALILATGAVLAATSRPENPRDSVARVELAQGLAQLERNGLTIDLQSGQTVARRDQVRTGPTGRVSLLFHDGSRLAVGENALLLVADYVAEEGRRRGALILDLIRGAIRLVASKAQRAPDKRIEVRTAAATLSSQGVDFWSGPVDDTLAVLLIAGKLDVRNEAGLVMLDRKRQVTHVSDRGTPPEKPTYWSVERARQSLLTVAFK
jgi:hypothetical protein